MSFPEEVIKSFRYFEIVMALTIPISYIEAMFYIVSIFHILRLLLAPE